MPSARFLTTRWTLVLKAAQTGAAEDALEQLCRIYWYPLYVYVRRRGNDPHEAEDLTQEFFARLLDRHWLEGVQPEGGRFRSFLLTMLNRYLANEWDRTQAQKRGGGQTIVTGGGNFELRGICRAVTITLTGGETVQVAAVTGPVTIGGVGTGSTVRLYGVHSAVTNTASGSPTVNDYNTAQTGADSDTLETLSDQLDTIAAASGAGTYSYSNTVDDGSGNLLDGVYLELATDTGFTNIVSSTYSNALGAFTVRSDTSGTHYLRLQLAGYSFATQTVTLA